MTVNSLAKHSKRAFVALAATASLVACLSPTLPLPPPDEPDSIEASTTEGFWNVRGNCTPGAVVLIENVATGEVTGTEDRDYDGRYFVSVAAQVCDVAEVYEILDTTVSATTLFVFEPVTNGVPEGDSCQVE